MLPDDCQDEGLYTGVVTLQFGESRLLAHEWGHYREMVSA